VRGCVVVCEVGVRTCVRVRACVLSSAAATSGVRFAAGAGWGARPIFVSALGVDVPCAVWHKRVACEQAN
jgi:hypothetical protein